MAYAKQKQADLQIATKAFIPRKGLFLGWGENMAIVHWGQATPQFQVHMYAQQG